MIVLSIYIFKVILWEIVTILNKTKICFDQISKSTSPQRDVCIKTLSFWLLSLSVMSFCFHLLSFLLLSLFVMSIVHTLEVARMRSGKMGTSNYLSIVRILQDYVNLPSSSKVDAKEALKNVNHIKIAYFLSSLTIVVQPCADPRFSQGQPDYPLLDSFNFSNLFPTCQHLCNTGSFNSHLWRRLECDSHPHLEG